MLTRSDFLVAASSLAAAAAAPSPADEMQTLHQILSRPAHHRVAIGMPNLANGAPLSSMYALYDAYENKLHEAAQSLNLVAVLYHGFSIGFAYNDDVWNRYLIPALADATPAAAPKAGSGNPYKAMVQQLVDRGATFLVCENSFNAGAAMFAQKSGEDVKTVTQRLRAALMPSSHLVPSGVMTLVACQEAGFSYIAA